MGMYMCATMSLLGLLLYMLHATVVWILHQMDTALPFYNLVRSYCIIHSTDDQRSYPGIDVFVIFFCYKNVSSSRFSSL
jgi:hypothetical protein